VSIVNIPNITTPTTSEDSITQILDNFTIYLADKQSLLDSEMAELSASNLVNRDEEDSFNIIEDDDRTISDKDSQKTISVASEYPSTSCPAPQAFDAHFEFAARITGRGVVNMTNNEPSSLPPKPPPSMHAFATAQSLTLERLQPQPKMTALTPSPLNVYDQQNSVDGEDHAVARALMSLSGAQAQLQVDQHEVNAQIEAENAQAVNQNTQIDIQKPLSETGSSPLSSVPSITGLDLPHGEHAMDIDIEVDGDLSMNEAEEYLDARSRDHVLNVSSADVAGKGINDKDTGNIAGCSMSRSHIVTTIHEDVDIRNKQQNVNNDTQDKHDAVYPTAVTRTVAVTPRRRKGGGPKFDLSPAVDVTTPYPSISRAYHGDSSPIKSSATPFKMPLAPFSVALTPAPGLATSANLQTPASRPASTIHHNTPTDFSFSATRLSPIKSPIPHRSKPRFPETNAVPRSQARETRYMLRGMPVSDLVPTVMDALRSSGAAASYSTAAAELQYRLGTPGDLFDPDGPDGPIAPGEAIRQIVLPEFAKLVGDLRYESGYVKQELEAAKKAVFEGYLSYMQAQQPQGSPATAAGFGQQQQNAVEDVLRRTIAEMFAKLEQAIQNDTRKSIGIAAEGLAAAKSQRVEYQKVIKILKGVKIEFNIPKESIEESRNVFLHRFKMKSQMLRQIIQKMEYEMDVSAKARKTIRCLDYLDELIGEAKSDMSIMRKNIAAQFEKARKYFDLFEDGEAIRQSEGLGSAIFTLQNPVAPRPGADAQGDINMDDSVHQQPIPRDRPPHRLSPRKRIANDLSDEELSDVDTLIFKEQAILPAHCQADDAAPEPELDLDADLQEATSSLSEPGATSSYDEDEAGESDGAASVSSEEYQSERPKKYSGPRKRRRSAMSRESVSSDGPENLAPYNTSPKRDRKRARRANVKDKIRAPEPATRHCHKAGQECPACIQAGRRHRKNEQTKSSAKFTTSKRASSLQEDDVKLSELKKTASSVTARPWNGQVDIPAQKAASKSVPATPAKTSASSFVERFESRRASTVSKVSSTGGKEKMSEERPRSTPRPAVTEPRQAWDDEIGFGAIDRLF
jgi:hypothetical protein